MKPRSQYSLFRAGKNYLGLQMMTKESTSPEIPPKSSSINLQPSTTKTSFNAEQEEAAMVLDEASPQASGSMPTSDGQNYDGNPLTIPSASNLRLQINPESIVTPDPFTLYFGFGGNMNWQRNVVRAISERVDNSRVLMGRNPTQEEVDAFVTHSTRSLYEKRIGAPLTGAIVAVRLYSQARSSTYFRGMMGLPPMPAAGAAEAGAKPVMPTLKQMVDGVITTAKVDAAGFRSGLGMVASRFFVWTITGATVSGVFAVYNDAVGTFSDSRLSEFVKQVKNQDPEELRKRKVDAAQERHRTIQQQRQQSQSDQTQDQDRLSTGIIGSDQSPQQQQQGAAAGIAESQKYEQENNGYASLYSETKSNSQRDQQQQQQQQQQPLPFESRPSSQDSVSDFFDDASPTAPEYQGTPAPSTITTTPTPQRGAWERIRQQNLGFSGQQDNSNSSNEGDRYQEYNARYGGNTSSYQGYDNSSDNDRQREREQARAEFERMLDAERNMSSDDSSSSGRDGRGGWWK